MSYQEESKRIDKAEEPQEIVLLESDLEQVAGGASIDSIQFFDYPPKKPIPPPSSES